MIYYAVRKMEIDISERDIHRSRPVIVGLISAQYYDSIADCDLSLAMMKVLIYNKSIFFIEKQSFHGGNFPSV